MRGHLRRALRQRNLRLHGGHPGRRVLPERGQRDRRPVRLPRLRRLVLLPPARRDHLRPPRRPHRPPADARLRHHADQRRDRGDRHPADVREHRHRGPGAADPAACRAGLLGRRRGLRRDELPRRARPRGQARPLHELRPDRLVPLPAHRHTDRRRHDQRPRPGPYGVVGLAHPVPARRAARHHRHLHPQADQRHPQLQPPQGRGGLSKNPLKEAFSSPSTAGPCCSPCSSRS